MFANGRGGVIPTNSVFLLLTPDFPHMLFLSPWSSISGKSVKGRWGTFCSTNRIAFGKFGCNPLYLSLTIIYTKTAIQRQDGYEWHLKNNMHIWDFAGFEASTTGKETSYLWNEWVHRNIFQNSNYWLGLHLQKNEGIEWALLLQVAGYAPMEYKSQ